VYIASSKIKNMAIRSLLTIKGAVLTTVVIAVVGSAFISYSAVKGRGQPEPPVEPQGVKTTEATKAGASASDSETSRAGTTKENSNPIGNKSIDSSTVSIKIINSYQQDSGDLIVQTSINGAGSGRCVLTLTKGSASINKSADLLYQPSFSTCKGFAVPIHEFPEGGTWSLKLTLLVNGVQKADTQKDIVINK
jgi:hypothetical protein